MKGEGRPFDKLRADGLVAGRLSFDAVSLARGGRVLFAELSFDLCGGDALLVRGANGAGKSSLLRLAAGLLDASEGVVTRAGGVALADERLALDDMPLAQALDFWARLDGGAVELDTVGLAHLAEVPVRMLSTGQRKRAGLARMAASGAAVWLLDEPGNGLDTASLARIEGLVDYHRARGGIAVVATHQPFALPDAREIAL